MGATPTQYLPITIADFTSLQKKVHQHEQDKALLTIWAKIAKQHPTVPQFQVAAQIRTWLNDASNAPLLNGITALRLDHLRLRVLPPKSQSLRNVKA